MIQSLRLLVSAATGGNSVYCHTCGAPNDDPAVFCKKCGTALQKTNPPSGTTAPTYPAAVQYAGFWRRFAAALIDGLITAPVSFVIQMLFGVSPFSGGLVRTLDTPDEAFRYLVRYIVANSLVMVLAWLYSALMESSRYQATLGKMALGIVVTDMNGQRISFGRATGRYFGKIVSSIILLIGYFMIAFTQKKQGLHDIMADCLVVVKR
jgi:uncharacterized RDD family membrane protein YckC